MLSDLTRIYVFLLCVGTLAVSKNYNVDVGPGLTFSPAITSGVVLGDTIRFSFKSAGHTATLLTGVASSCTFATGGWTFPASGVSVGGEQLTLTISSATGFSGPGTYSFGCQPHCSLGMRGSIVIAGTTAATTPTTGPAGGTCVPQTINVAVGPGGARQFTPASIVAVLGDTVVFDFQSAGHSARSNVAGLTSCDFSTAWAIPITAVGTQVSLAISTTNGFQTGVTTTFSCEPHCASGMTGQISVVACGGVANGTGNSTLPPGGGGGGLFFRPILIAHIVLMSLAFAFFMLLGLIPATFSFGAWWFPAHWVMMSSAFVLACIGFVVIVVEVQGNGVGHFSSLLGSPTQGAHPVLGVILIGLVVCQVSAGVVANYWWQHKHGKGLDTSRPAVVDHLHRWLGRFVVIASMVQIFLGVREALLPDWVYGIFAAWYGVVIVVVVAIMVATNVLKLRTLGGAKIHHAEEPLVKVQEPSLVEETSDQFDSSVVNL